MTSIDNRSTGSAGSTAPSVPDDEIKPAPFPARGTYVYRDPVESHPEVYKKRSFHNLFACCPGFGRRDSVSLPDAARSVLIELDQFAGPTAGSEAYEHDDLDRPTTPVDTSRSGSIEASPPRQGGTTEPQFLRLNELHRVMHHGEVAEKKSNLFQPHIAAFKQVAKETDSILMFRPVNQNATYYIGQEDFPVKGLSVKNKSAKEGFCAGLLPVPFRPGRSSHSSTISLQMSRERVDLLFDRKKIKRLPPREEYFRPDEDVDRQAVSFVQERDTRQKKIYRLELVESGTEEPKFKVSERLDNGSFGPVRVKGKDGKPLTADYDLFAILPRIKPKNFAGCLDFTEDMAEIQALPPGSRFRALSEFTSKRLLGQEERANVDRDRGRITNWQKSVVDRLNAAARQTGRRAGDIVQHGTEQDNTQYPERNGEIFAILPDGGTLRTTRWEHVQAVMYAASQDGFLVYENRAYNRKAGNWPLYKGDDDAKKLQLKGNGARIPFNGKEAAAAVYRMDRDRMAADAKRAQAGPSSNPSKPSPQRYTRADNLRRQATLSVKRDRHLDEASMASGGTTPSATTEADTERNDSLELPRTPPR